MLTVHDLADAIKDGIMWAADAPLVSNVTILVTYPVPPTGKATLSVLGTDGEAFLVTVEVSVTEQERVRLYHQLIAEGLSDSEARGTAWPEPD